MTMTMTNDLWQVTLYFVYYFFLPETTIFLLILIQVQSNFLYTRTQFVIFSPIVIACSFVLPLSQFLLEFQLANPFSSFFCHKRGSSFWLYSISVSGVSETLGISIGLKDMNDKAWNWAIGLTYIVSVAAIWIAASFVVQSVVDAGVSPFLITYICNSLFVVYIPIVEIGRYLEDSYGSLWFWRGEEESNDLKVLGESEQAILLEDNDASNEACSSWPDEQLVSQKRKSSEGTLPNQGSLTDDLKNQLDAKGRWTRYRVAKVSLLICPFWFFAQLTFNLSLKYTTVTSNTILSSASSLFTFLASLAILGEKFTWIKLFSVLLCMGGTIIVSLGDSQSVLSAIASNPFVGDILALVSAALYAVYITLIRKKLPDNDGKSGRASMAQFLGYLGLFNLFIFLPIALVLNLTKVEPFHSLTWKQLGLIIGKGLLDNVLSDYLWAKAVLLTSTTVATAGLMIQVPLAAIVDSLTGHAPGLLDCLGAVAVMIGFAGINIPSDAFKKSREASVELENECVNSTSQHSGAMS